MSYFQPRNESIEAIRKMEIAQMSNKGLLLAIITQTKWAYRASMEGKTDLARNTEEDTEKLKLEALQRMGKGGFA